MGSFHKPCRFHFILLALVGMIFALMCSLPDHQDPTPVFSPFKTTSIPANQATYPPRIGVPSRSS
jgi:hypothetical protein